MSNGVYEIGSNILLQGFIDINDNVIILGHGDQAYIQTSTTSNSLDIVNDSGQVNIQALDTIVLDAPSTIVSGNILMEQGTYISNISENFGILLGLTSPVSTDKLLILGDLEDSVLNPPSGGKTNTFIIGADVLGVQDMYLIHANYDNETDTYLSLGTNGIVIRHNDESGIEGVKSYVQCKENVIIESTSLVGSPNGNIELNSRYENGNYGSILNVNPKDIRIKCWDETSNIDVFSATTEGITIEGIGFGKGNTFTNYTAITGTQGITSLVDTRDGGSFDVQGFFRHVGGSTRISQQDNIAGAGYALVVSYEEITLELDALTGLLRIVGLKTFSDNGAAIAGGLGLNHIYKTADGNLKIVT